MKKGVVVSFILIVISIAIGIYFYPQFPPHIASHWNAAGNVNGYMPKFWGVFLLPIILIFVILLLIIIPPLDPKKENIKKFSKYFDNFIALLSFFLFYLYLLTTAWNLGKRFNMIQMLAPAFALFIYYAGVLIEKSEPNFTIGIRTPWTLSSESVWTKTHVLGAKLFKIAGGLALLGIVLPQLAIFFILIPLLLAAFIPVVYSYFEYQKEVKQI